MKTSVKRILSLLLVLALMAGLCVTAMAAGEPTLTVETAAETAEPGDEVTLAVALSDNPGFAGTGIYIDYDRDRLELKSINNSYTKVIDGEELELYYLAGSMAVTELAKRGSEADGTDPDKTYGFITSAAYPDVTKDGTLFSVTFTVKEGAETGTAAVSLIVDKFTNADDEDLNPTVVSGGIQIKGVPPVCKHPGAVYHAAVQPTCTEGGNSEYWVCPDCGKIFADAAFTVEIDAVPTIAALGHDYVDGVCTRCGELQPAYELYIEFEPDTDADNDGAVDVTAGQQVTAKLMLRSATDAEINSFTAKAVFDAKLTAGTPETAMQYEKISGGYHLYSYAAGISAKAGEPVEIAKVPVTVAADAVSGVTMQITLSDASVMAGNSIEVITATTKDGSLEINAFQITFETDSGTYSVEYPAGSMPSFDDVEEEGATTDKAGYTFTGWSPELAPVTERATYTAQYSANDYTITFTDEDGNTVGTVDYTYGATSVTEPEVPAKDGYAGEWEDYDLTVPGDKSVKPEYTANTYTITFEDCDKEAAEYTIEDTTAIGEASKDGYTFIGWTVKADAGNWTAGESIDKADVVTGRYGDVTLTAQWVVSAEISFEDYAYAESGQILIVVQAAKLDSGNYMFDGQPLYWTDSSDYGAKGAYITLVDAKWARAGALETAKALTIDAKADAAVTVDRDGDINGDGTVDVHDAGVVYKILSTNGDAFTDLTILDRLECDVATSQANSSYRGSIADVNAIMDIYLAG